MQERDGAAETAGDVVPEPVVEDPAIAAEPAPDELEGPAGVPAESAPPPEAPEAGEAGPPPATPRPDDAAPPPPAPGEVAPAAVGEIVAGSIGRMERQLDELARLGARNAEHVGALHAENQRLRAGEIGTAVGPLLRDVIRLHDDIGRLEAACAPEAAADLQLVRQLLTGTLDRWGIRPFEPSSGDTFDPAAHNGLARVETADHADNTVATVRRCGFRADDGRIWRPADVDVYRLIKPPAVDEE